MAGTTVSNSRTFGIRLTLASQSPVLITSSGAIVTTGGYAVADTASLPVKLTNDGKLIAATYGVVVAGAQSVITNNGTIGALAANGVGVQLGNGGTLTNGAGHHISGGGYGVRIRSASGSVGNLGTISGVAVTGVAMAADGQVTNGQSKGSASAVITGGNGVIIGGIGTVANWGRIEGTGNLGVDIGNGGSVANGSSAATARVIVGAAYGVRIGGAVGAVSNDGTIQATNANGVAVQLGDGGTVTNGAANARGWSILGGGYGVRIRSATGVVTNFGTISGASSVGVSLAVDGRVSNGKAGLKKAVITGANGVLIAGTGSVANFGTIIGAGNVGVGIGNGGSVANGATNSNNATIAAALYGVRISSARGVVSNEGKITGTTANGIGVQLGDGGEVDNGTAKSVGWSIIGGSYGVRIRTADGVVSNFGTIIGAATTAVAVAVNATVTNGAATSADWLIGGANGVVISGTGNVTNFGTIAGTGNLGIDLGNGGSVANGSATATKRLIKGATYGIRVGVAAGFITNDGTIAGTAANSIGVQLGGGGTVTNGAGWLITGSSYGVRVRGAAAVIANLGTISGITTAAVAISNGAVVTNGDRTGAKWLISGANGVIIGGIGTVTNWGTIAGTGSRGVDISAGGSVANGSTTASGRVIKGGQYGVRITGSPGTVTNDGTIAGTNANGVAVQFSAGGSLSNGASNAIGAIITGGSYGVRALGADATVSNFGSIIGANEAGIDSLAGAHVTNGQSTGTKWLITGNSGVLIGAAGVVANWGSIIGTGDIGVAIGNGGSVTNGAATATGRVIKGATYGVRISAAAGHVGNYGAITATTVGGIGVELSGGGTLANGAAKAKHASISGGTYGVRTFQRGVVDNFGTISGRTGIVLANGGTVVNAGAIRSTSGATGVAVAFGTGAHRFVAEAGSSVVGKITGAASAATLELASGGGSIGGIGSALSFGTIAVDAGANWTLSGANSAAAIGGDGTVALASGASLKVATASGGEFALNGGASLEIGTVLGTGMKVAFLGASRLTIGSSLGDAVSSVRGFGAGDAIDLKDMAAAGLAVSYATSSGELLISHAGMATLAFDGATLGAGSFHVTSDGGHGTLLTHS